MFLVFVNGHKKYLHKYKRLFESWKSVLFVNFSQFPCSWIRIRISNPDPDLGEPNQCGSGSTTYVLYPQHRHFFRFNQKIMVRKLGCVLLGMLASFLVYKYLEKPLLNDASMAVVESIFKELGSYLASPQPSRPTWKKESVGGCVPVPYPSISFSFHNSSFIYLIMD
jgi:hypothetical protein